MGIKVKHDVDSGVLGDAAYNAGKAQGSERRREQDRSYETSKEVNQIREKARQDANARFFAQLQSSNEGRRDEQAFRQEQYDNAPDRARELGEIGNDLKEDMVDFQHSRSQQAELAKLDKARDYVSRNVDGKYTPDEQKAILQQIDQAQFGIKPLQRKNLPWPKQQDTGQIWQDQSSGATLTRDDKGNVKVLVKPDDANSFANKIKLKESISKHAKDIFDTHEMAEKSLTWQQSLQMSQDFFSDMHGDQNSQAVPDNPTNSDIVNGLKAAGGNEPAGVEPRTQQILNDAMDSPQGFVDWSMGEHGRETALELEIILNSKDKSAILEAFKRLGVI